MKRFLFISFLVFSAIASFGQFADTGQINQFFRDTIKDRRPEKVTAAQLQKGFLGLSGLLGNTIPLSQKGANNGVAALDPAGKVPFSSLPSALMIYKGVWDPSTNTPTLSDAAGVSGWVYKATANGTVNLGSGAITFYAGDFIIYNGTKWERSVGTDNVVSVNGQQGVVTLSFISSLANVGVNPNMQGGTVSGTVLTLQPADESNPGLMTTGNQTFDGWKRYKGTVNMLTNLYIGQSTGEGGNGGFSPTFYMYSPNSSYLWSTNVNNGGALEFRGTGAVLRYSVTDSGKLILPGYVGGVFNKPVTAYLGRTSTGEVVDAAAPSTPALANVLQAGNSANNNILLTGAGNYFQTANGGKTSKLHQDGLDLLSGIYQASYTPSSDMITNGSNSIMRYPDYLLFNGNGNIDAVRLKAITPATGSYNVYIPANNANDTLATKADVRAGSGSGGAKYTFVTTQDASIPAADVNVTYYSALGRAWTNNPNGTADTYGGILGRTGTITKLWVKHNIGFDNTKIYKLFVNGVQKTTLADVGNTGSYGVASFLVSGTLSIPFTANDQIQLRVSKAYGGVTDYIVSWGIEYQ